MTNFFKDLKSLFEDIPTKTNFLKDLNFSNSYIGFRYFLQGHQDEPSPKFMKKMSDELGYDYVQIPIKRGEESQLILNKIETDFKEDLKLYLKKYEGDTTNPNSKKRKASVSEVISTFQIEKDILDPSKQLDVSDLF